MPITQSVCHNCKASRTFLQAGSLLLGSSLCRKPKPNRSMQPLSVIPRSGYLNMRTSMPDSFSNCTTTLDPDSSYVFRRRRLGRA
eukprot:scaffold3038_cov163-Amphora_coffeaeformis.AAC.2